MMTNKNAGVVCAETEKIVSRCPTALEFDQIMILRKCFGVCGDLKGHYKYHCVRDSLKENFIEICAIPKRLFDYCPEYDRIGQQIQMDISTLCNTTHSSRRYYDSSDISFCNPDNCLQLFENKVDTTRTTKRKDVSPNNEGDKHNRISQNWYFILFPALLVIATLIAMVCAIFLKSKYDIYLRKDPPKVNKFRAELLLNVATS